MTDTIDDYEAEAVARWDAEEAERKARHAAQVERADLTPHNPPPGKWLVESAWKPLPSDLGVDEITVDGGGDLDSAYRAGGQTACCAGALRMRVVGPDGRVHYSWDREGKYLLAHSPEAIAREKAIRDRIHAQMMAR